MKKSRLILIFIIIFTAAGVLLFPASEEDKYISLNAGVDELLSQLGRPGIPGFAAAVIKDGKVVYRKGFGYANLEYGIAITPKTVFDVASLSKQFAGMAIAMLEEQGRLSLDDDIRKYVPEVPYFGKPITLRHLLHHTSGLRDWPQTMAVAGWKFEDVISFQQILKNVSYQQKLNFEPGSKYLYSNTGYNLLAETVKRITGKSFRRWTDENIFTPLGMTGTHVHDDHREIVKNRAYSYIYDKTKGYLKAVENLTAVGSSSLYSTVDDLAKWMLNLETGKVGGKALIRKIHTRGFLDNGDELNYAFGLNTGDYRGLKRVRHGGTWRGFRSTLHHYPGRQFGVVILCNLASYNPERLAEMIADIYLETTTLPAAGQVPASKGAAQTQIPGVNVNVNPADYRQYEGRYRLINGVVITITREDSRLMGQIEGQPPFELFPGSGGTFFLKVVAARVVFQRDEKGKVNRLILCQGGKDIPAEKFRRVKLTPWEMQQFTGSYYCDELDARYSIVIRDGRLAAAHRRHSDIFLEPEEGDRFSADEPFLNMMEFSRNKEGEVTGFKIDGSRARNIVFVKSAAKAP